MLRSVVAATSQTPSRNAQVSRTIVNIGVGTLLSRKTNRSRNHSQHKVKGKSKKEVLLFSVRNFCLTAAVK